MKIPRFLLALMPVLVTISFIRLVNQAGPLSLSDILYDLSTFEFDLDNFYELVAMFREGTFSDMLYDWNYDLTGIDGFFYNLGQTLSHFFMMIGLFYKTAWFAIFELFKFMIDLTFQILSLVVNILGFKASIKP